MKFDIESEVKKLYKDGKTRNEIISLLVNKYNKVSVDDWLNGINLRITSLEIEKERIKNSKFMEEEDRDTYYFGMVVVVVVSGTLFYELPILIPINLSIYGASIPLIKVIYKLKKERNIKKELEILNIIKDYLDSKVFEEETTLVKSKNK